MNGIKRVSFPVSALPFPSACDRLAASACPVFFPASIIRNGEQIQVFFSTEGFKRLRDLKAVPADFLLLIVKEILKALEVCRDRFWFPEELIFSTDTIYVSTEGQVRLLYIPDGRNISAEKKLAALLHSMKDLTDSRGCMYLETCMQLITVENLRSRRILAFLDHLLQGAGEDAQGMIT